MTFPLPYTVGHRVYVAGVEDDLGMPAESWAAPVAKQVIGWGAPTSSEPHLIDTVGLNRNVVDVELLVPPGFSCGARDRFILDFDPDAWVEDIDAEFDVVGHPGHFDHSPFGWNPGGVVKLKAVNG